MERILSMVDSVLLLVDAVDGPMPQTRFVTQKAFKHGLKPIVVVNKVDRPGARPHWVIDQVFELFDRLGATDEQLDFPVVYASALGGYAGLEAEVREGDMTPLFEAITRHVNPPNVNAEGALQMQVSQLDYSSYVGAIAVGKITRGKVKRNMPVTVVGRDGKSYNARIGQVLGYMGLQRTEVEEASAGDIIAITGIEAPQISDTICSQEVVEVLPPLAVDEPTVTMTFQVNTSPFAGRDGKYVTSRQIGDRLQRELVHNVALRVEETDDPDKFRVSGRGELHLGILIETMRREGFELGVSRPEVIFKTIDGVRQEPYETLTVDVEEEHQGAIMEKLGARSGMMENMMPDGKGRVRLDYMIPARGLIGFQTEFMTATRGTGLLYHSFDHYGPAATSSIASRINGVMIASDMGKAVAYALFNIQERGRLFIEHGTEVYEGMVIGIHSRDSDLIVNPMKGKQLTNVRSSGADEKLILTPPIKFSLEQALEFIEDDELVEVTPKAIRIRKKLLQEHERKRADRAAKD